MNQQHNIHCPDCNEILQKREVSDGELIECYCSKCKKDIIYKVEIKLRIFTEN